MLGRDLNRLPQPRSPSPRALELGLALLGIPLRQGSVTHSDTTPETLTEPLIDFPWSFELVHGVEATPATTRLLEVHPLPRPPNMRATAVRVKESGDPGATYTPAPIAPTPNMCNAESKTRRIQWHLKILSGYGNSKS